MLTLAALDAALAKFEVEVREVRAAIAAATNLLGDQNGEGRSRKVRQWKKVEGAELDRVLEMLARGERTSVIARELGRPNSTIRRIQRKWQEEQAEQKEDRKVG